MRSFLINLVSWFLFMFCVGVIATAHAVPVGPAIGIAFFGLFSYSLMVHAVKPVEKVFDIIGGVILLMICGFIVLPLILLSRTCRESLVEAIKEHHEKETDLPTAPKVARIRVVGTAV